MRDYENCKIPDFASAVRHLGEATGVACEINEVPFLKAKGLFSLPTISEDLVRIANKYGLSETITNEVSEAFRQFTRIIRNLSAQGVIDETDFDRFFE